MKNRFVVLVLLVASMASAALQIPRNHVPERLTDEIRPFFAAAVNRPHLLLVNVGHAVPEQDWTLASTYAASRLQLNIWTNSVEKISVEQLMTDVSITEKLFSDSNAKVGVYFVNGKNALPVVSAPGHWAVVDVSDASLGNPDVQTFRDRIAKLVLRGIAMASGGGSTVEPFCAMFYRATTIRGLDSVNIMLAPMCYFPMLEILRSVGGVEITMPVQ